MSTSTTARRPIQITEFKSVIKDLPTEQLHQIRAELENSIRHLDRSNARLNKYIAKIEGKREDTPDGVDQEELDKIDSNDLQLYQDSHRENEIVLRNYYERLEALDEENAYRSSGSRVTKPGSAHTSGARGASAQAAVDTDNTNGDTNAPNSVYL